jgi:integrase
MVMKRALTARSVEATKPGKVRREIPDAHMPGLYLVVQPSGARSWAVRYRNHGRPRKHTLGGFPAVDLATARTLAGKALRAAAEGRDPGTEKAKSLAARANSVGAIAAEFIEKYSRQNNRPATVRQAERLLELHVLPHWRTRAIDSITRRDVLDLLDRITDGGKPISANRTFSAIRKMFNWCASRDIIAASPCAGVRPPAAEQARDRVLTDDELKLVWAAAGRVGYPFGTLAQLLILTGQRRDEVAKMQWSEVDLDKKLWTLPRERTKNDKPHDVPLSDLAVSILNALPRLKDCSFVFSTNGETPASGYGKGKRRLDALLPADMPPWRLHDLRRTVASGMARLGVNLPVIEKVLNHVSGSFGGIVAVYQRHEFGDEKRRALDAWANHLLLLFKPDCAS